jgi:hypothetical protein
MRVFTAKSKRRGNAGLLQHLDFIESHERNFQGISKLLQISPKIFSAVLSVFNGLQGGALDACLEGLARGAIDFSVFKQPNEYRLEFRKKQISTSYGCVA